MSISHIIDPLGERQDIYCKNLNVSGTSNLVIEVGDNLEVKTLEVSQSAEVKGITINENGIACVGNINKNINAGQNSVIEIDRESGLSSVVQFQSNSVNSSSITENSNGLTFNSTALIGNKPWSYTSIPTQSGSGTLTLNQPIGLLTYTSVNIASGAVGQLDLSNNLININTVLRCTIQKSSSLTNSYFSIVHAVCSVGDAKILLHNMGSSSTGGAASVTILFEIIA